MQFHSHRFHQQFAINSASDSQCVNVSDVRLTTALVLWVALGSVHLALITLPVALINYVRSLPLANVLLRLRVLCFHRRICDLQHSHTDIRLIAHVLDCVSRMRIALLFLFFGPARHACCRQSHAFTHTLLPAVSQTALQNCNRLRWLPQASVRHPRLGSR